MSRFRLLLWDLLLLPAVVLSAGAVALLEAVGFLGTFGVAFCIVGVVGGIFILLGGIKMRRLESYGLSMAASIVAMIPCLSACCLIGFPIGIWSLVILSKAEVKSVFH